MDLPLPQFARDPVDFLFPPLPAACTHIGLYLSLTLSADPLVRSRLLATALPVIVSAVTTTTAALTQLAPFAYPFNRRILGSHSLTSYYYRTHFFSPSMSIHHAHNLPPSPSSEGQASQPPPTPTTASQATQAAPAKRSSRRANTAERRATHNAVERARRETLNGRFLVSVFLP